VGGKGDTLSYIQLAYRMVSQLMSMTAVAPICCVTGQTWLLLQFNQHQEGASFLLLQLSV